MVHIRKIKNGDFVFLVSLLIISLSYAEISDEKLQPMSHEEREALKEESRDMFYHAYRAYMENAYPADELMPLSCQGRWRDSMNSRGDLDDVLGNYSLTLIDSLDTLVILGDLEEFEHAIKLVIKDVSFDQDVVVSVFETNIRVLGGLISAHILAEYLQQRAGIIEWYQAELLTLAKDLGFRMLPAFNTTTGIPHSRINLRHGLKNMRLSAFQETCTACAGTMILELAALSRLTGEPVFEEKAHRAMDELWRMRHRSSDLMGTVLNVQSGDWIRRDSGVGAGIDSYYEYCLKAYILLGDERYLGRFNRHYNAVMKYVSQGPLLVDVHMHRPHTNSKNFMDALLAFWPGLQVLKGDIKPAVATHEMLYQVMQRHNLLPEAFTTDFQVHWGQHPLRPEFVESTYFLYKATNDPYYLEVGKDALKSLQKYARVPCGYATVKDVRTGGHDDRMDSFVLAETFKYLFLLFADPSELVLDLDEFLFTTEAHLLPLTLSRNHYNTSVLMEQHRHDDNEDVDHLAEFARSCPNTLNLFPESVRKPLKNMVDGICPRRTVKRKLQASQFVSGNSDHLKLLKDMGITVMSLADGRVQLLHSITSARSSADAEEGLLFMQEMVELSQAQKQISDKSPLTVSFQHVGARVAVSAGPAHFGRELSQGGKIAGRVGVAEPYRACDKITNPDRLKGRIVIIERGDCMFINKVRRVEEAGAVGAIVIDNTPGTSSMTSSMFAMSGDGTNDVTIPAVFLFFQDASQLLKSIQENPGLEITISDTVESGDDSTTKSTAEDKSTDSLINRLAGSFQQLLGRNDKFSEINVGEFRATVEQLAGGKEIIRIAQRQDGPTPPPTTTMFDTKIRNEEKLLNDFKEAISKTNTDDIIPMWLLQMYQKLGVGSKDVKQTDWLLAQLKMLNKDDLDEGGVVESTKEVEETNTVPKTIENEETKKFLYILKYQLIRSILQDKLKNLKQILELQPASWEVEYVEGVSYVKSLITKLEKFPEQLIDNSLYDVDDVRIKEMKLLLKNRKEKLDLLKFTVKQLEQVCKLIFNNNNNDDIIVTGNEKKDIKDEL